MPCVLLSAAIKHWAEDPELGLGVPSALRIIRRSLCTLLHTYKMLDLQKNVSCGSDFGERNSELSIRAATSLDFSVWSTKYENHRIHIHIV